MNDVNNIPPHDRHLNGADLNAINEFNLRPGAYQHYKGGLYVVFTVVTHMDGVDGKMTELADPLVCYRDLVPIKRHVNGAQREAHQVYARPMSEFRATVQHGDIMIKRFTSI